MRKTLALLGAGCAVGLLVGAAGMEALKAQAPPIKRTELQRVDIKDIDGREGVMYIADFAPGGAAPRHFHPGTEFFYILEGTLIVEPDGQQPITLKKGDVGYNHARHVHVARNGSASEPAKVLAFLVIEKGQPLATPVE